MTTYNTGNPVPSTEVKDLFDNCQTEDEFCTSAENTTINRLGVILKTMAGMNADFYDFLAESGFEPVHLIYVNGTPLQVDRPTQFIDRAGLVYRVKMPSTFPVMLTGTWATDAPLLLDVGDQSLRTALAAPGGATLIEHNGTTVESALDTIETNISTLQTNVATLQTAVSVSPKTVLAYGTPTGVNDTAMAQAMITATNSLIVPKGVTLAVKNLTLNDDTLVYCQGVLKLRSGCADFDKILYAPNKSRLNIYVAELDGNAAGQSGAIGTHLFYGTNNVDSIVNIDYAHHHYYPTTAVIVNTDGIRDTSSGAIFLYRPVRGSTSVKYLYSWGREGVQCREGTRHTVRDTKCQGVDGGGEYSGIQISGTWNQGLNLNVDNAGASGIGWDTAYGVGTNWIVTNTRENHGVNVGHAGFPATGSVLQGMAVDGAYRCGIQVSATTLDLAISDVTVRNAGELGISISDSSERLRVSNALIEYAGFGNLSTSATTLKAYNIYNVALDAGGVLVVTPVTGSFVAGETVTSGAITGVIRKVIKNRDGSSQTLFLASKSGTFVAASAITGGTSAASGTISVVRIPVAQRAIGGGVITVV